MRIVISTISPVTDGKSDLDQFHPNMIHLLRKEEDGKNRVPSKEPVPSIDHWQLELELRRSADDWNLFVRNKLGEKDQSRGIQRRDFLFSVGTDKIIRFGKERKNLHLTVLHPKTEQRAKGDDISLDKIVKERIENEQSRKEILRKFQGKNSRNLKRVQLKCQVYDLETNALIGSAISGVIKDKSSKDFGSLEMKEVRPRVSCSEGGRNILVVTEHPMKKGSVVPVFQLFDDDGNRLRDDERLVTQPEVIEADDRTLKFSAPKQVRFMEWSERWQLKLRLRRREETEESESISWCLFQYRLHNSLVLPAQGQSDLCLYCSPNLLDGDTADLAGASLPSHSGPGLKRRRVSSAVRTQVTVVESRTLEQDIDNPDPETEIVTTSSVLNIEDKQPSASLSLSCSLDTMPPVSQYPPDQILSDGSNPRQRLEDVQEEVISVRRRMTGRRGLRWWIQTLFGDDQEAQEVLGSQDVSLRRKIQVILRHYPLLPLIITALIIVSFISTVSLANLLAILFAVVIAMTLIVYQNFLQINGEE